MAKGLEETLLALLADPAALAAQADLAQAAALARQELSFRQRAGAAAFALRVAKAEGADEAEIADLQTVLDRRTARLDAAQVQAATANLKRPFPDDKQAQIFGRATGPIDKPPLTAAVLSEAGEVVATAVVAENGTFHLTAEGALNRVAVQMSDAAGGVQWRSTGALDIAVGTVLYLDVALSPPSPEPGPVPSGPRMPDLVGQDERVAQALLSRLGVAEVTILDKTAEGLPGIVIEQSPRAGAALKDGAKVSLTVRRASGDAPEPTFLPGLVGRPAAEAEAVLKSLGLRVAIRRQADGGPEDMVLAQSPAEGTLLVDVKSVELMVSRARDPVPDTVLVPDLTGQSVDLVQQVLKATDLQLDLTEIAEAGVPEGVVRQDPAAGTPVARKSVVKVTLNRPPVVEPGLVAVPNLVGSQAAGAQKLLATLDLKSALVPESGAAPEGQILRQDPAAATRVKAGEIVTLTVSTSKPASAPDRGTLIAAMARDPRAREGNLSEARLADLFERAGIITLDDARALAGGTAKDIRSRLNLETAAEATMLRAVLIATLKALG